MIHSWVVVFSTSQDQEHIRVESGKAVPATTAHTRLPSGLHLSPLIRQLSDKRFHGVMHGPTWCTDFTVLAIFYVVE